MNFKQIAVKAIAPVAAVAVLVASGALSALASFMVGTVPSNCVRTYGYQAGYGYGYGYETSNCATTGGGGGNGGNNNGNNGTLPNPVTPATPAIPAVPATNGGSATPAMPAVPADPKFIGMSLDGDICNANSNMYDDESKKAYLFACVNNITTKRSIDRSVFNGMLIRKEMAKMISNYAINIMKMTPDTSKACNFDDIAGEDAEMKMYIKTACQLGLMGYKGDGVTKAASFNANNLVNRAMFATLFARMMYDNKYATAINSTDWAGPSLRALKADGILKNINPSLVEIRGYVWIVFDRANN